MTDAFPGAGGFRLPVGITGLQRQREWDAVVLAEAPGLEADETELVLLRDGTLLGDPAAEPLVRAVPLEPPFRAYAVRKSGALYSVGANEIEVAELPADVEGEELELSVRGEERILTMDGMRSFASISELEALGGGRADFVVRARRLAGRLWQADVEAL